MQCMTGTTEQGTFQGKVVYDCTAQQQLGGLFTAWVRERQMP